MPHKSFFYFDLHKTSDLQVSRHVYEYFYLETLVSLESLNSPEDSSQFEAFVANI
jgi:hypothetical protein